VVVRDEGSGFATDETSTGFGLVGMRERVALLDGELTIESTPGDGTTVRGLLPVRRSGPAQPATATG
jgi:signal transduction histidine kinase